MKKPYSKIVVKYTTRSWKASIQFYKYPKFPFKEALIEKTNTFPDKIEAFIDLPW